MPNSYEYLPSSPSGWHKWYPATRLRSLPREREFYLQPDMLPSTMFGVVNEYSTLSVWIDRFEYSMTLAVSALPMVATMVASGTVTIPVGLYVRLGRQQSWSTAGGNPPQIIAMRSPRFGYSIGSLFKHQAYIKLDVFGLGFTGPAYEIVWLDAAAIGDIEFTTNSRLKKFVVRHGKVVEATAITIPAEDAVSSPQSSCPGTAQADKLLVKLFENEFPPPVSGCEGQTPYWNHSGTITFYGMRTNGFASATMPFSKISATWHAVLDMPAQGSDPDAPPPFVPAAGDFYVLDKPIMCDDPQSMHEFNVRSEPTEDGVYVTDEQRHKVDTSVVGIWVYDDDPSRQLWVAYANPDERPRIVLPWNEGQVAMSNESNAFGGDLAAGLAAWAASGANTARLIVKAHGGGISQNLFAGNLTGEYAKFGDEYHEIIDQPRLDTIEVSNVGASSGKKLLSTGTDTAGAPTASLSTSSVTIYQQKFWKITELYTTYGSVQGRGALWGGKVASISQATDDQSATIPNAYVVEWDAKEPYGRLFLPQEERDATGIAMLPERFRTDVKTAANSPALGFVKFSGWKVVANGVEFSVVGARVDVTGEAAGYDFDVHVKMVVQGNPGAYASVGSPVYVVMGERYRNPFGGASDHNTMAVVNTKVAKETNYSAKAPKGQPTLYMYGHYHSGFYDLPMPIGSKSRLSIASHSYGVDGSDSMGCPMVWVTTRTGATGVCYLEHGTQHRQEVIFNDPEIDILASVGADSTDVPWSERRQKVTIHCGESRKTPASEGIPEGAYAITAMHSKIEPSRDPSSLKGFFVCLPRTGTSTGAYHSVRIEGYAGVATPLSIKMQASFPTSMSHPIDLPLEAYEPVGVRGEGEANVGVPVVAKVSATILSGCGLDEVNDTSRFAALRDGEQLPAVTPRWPATHFDFVKARQVLKGVKQFGAHRCSDGSLLLFYCKDSGKFRIAGSSDDNPSKPSLFVVRSGTDMDDWGSPRFEKSETAGDEAKHEEWERPLMIAYDFEFAGSVALTDDEFLLFGYGYARDSNNAARDGDRNMQFLGCHLVSYAGLRAGATHKCHYGEEATDQSTHFYFRPHHALETSPAHSMAFGQPMAGVPAATAAADDPANLCSERFTRIIGGTQSSALVTGYDLAQEVVGPGVDPSGMLSLFFRDPETDSIRRLWSCSRGGMWQLDVDDDDKAYSYATGACPTPHGTMLFYFFGESLHCKVLSSVSEGVFGTKQEQLDGARASVVASDVVGHRIAVNVDPEGRVFVFYLNKSGYIQAAGSATAGNTWEHVENW